MRKAISHWVFLEYKGELGFPQGSPYKEDVGDPNSASPIAIRLHLRGAEYPRDPMNRHPESSTKPIPRSLAQNRRPCRRSPSCTGLIDGAAEEAPAGSLYADCKGVMQVAYVLGCSSERCCKDARSNNGRNGPVSHDSDEASICDRSLSTMRSRRWTQPRNSSNSS